MASKICHETVHNPALLEKLLNEMQKQIETLAAKLDADDVANLDTDYAATCITVQRTK